MKEHVKRGPARVGLIGYGAIGRAVADAIWTGKVGRATLSAVLVRDRARYHPVVAPAERRGTFLTDDPERFFAAGFDLLVEAAGQGAVRAYAEPALQAGHDLLVVSIGAFTDDALYARLTELARNGDGRLLLAGGALPAVDWMQAAALAPVARVLIAQTKPVASWRGTPAEEMVDLDELAGSTCFFTGTAREAAHTFPKSSNITAMLALATVGLDRTEVRLIAEPHGDRMHTRIEFVGDAGSVTVEWQGTPSATNPSTSADVPLTVIKAIRDWTGDLVFGA